MAVRALRFSVRHHSRTWVGGALAVVVVVTGAVGWQVWKASRPTGHVMMEIRLDGPVCQMPAHQALCNRIARGGQIVIYGPIHSPSGFDHRQVTLHALDSRLSLRLEPGRYAFAFVVNPPWEVLLPDFGRNRNGAFHVHAGQTTTLGVIQPAAEWITIGD